MKEKMSGKESLKLHFKKRLPLIEYDSRKIEDCEILI